MLSGPIVISSQHARICADKRIEGMAERERRMSVSEVLAPVAVKTPLVANPDLLSAKPSLIGLTREDMAAALKEKGVPEKQVRMRVSQLWHWLYILSLIHI